MKIFVIAALFDIIIIDRFRKSQLGTTFNQNSSKLPVPNWHKFYPLNNKTTYVQFHIFIFYSIELNQVEVSHLYKLFLENIDSAWVGEKFWKITVNGSNLGQPDKTWGSNLTTISPNL